MAPVLGRKRFQDSPFPFSDIQHLGGEKKQRLIQAGPVEADLLTHKHASLFPLLICNTTVLKAKSVMLICEYLLTMATAKPRTVMMPKGMSTIPIPELSITGSGNAVALALVSLVVAVTVVNVVL